MTVVVLVLAGCDSGGGYGSSSGSSSSGGSGGSSAYGAAQVTMATATVKGRSTTILTNSHGKTLHYRTTDSASASTCIPDRAIAWPPLLTTGAPTAASSLPAKLSVLSDANGVQVTCNGHLLYTYAGDSKPGDTTGEGIGGVWFVATPDLAPQGVESDGGGAAPTPTTGSGYLLRLTKV